jgi:hypothetical protein
MDRADGDGQSDSLKQGKVHMNVKGLGLEAGEAVVDDLEPFTDGVEMIESLLQAEVVQVVGDKFIAQQAQELLIPFQECIFPVRPENVMPVFDLIDHRGQLSV